ncbi:hypothetical protein [Burkholderia multivorans]|uniref:hypothetical protein n=1 Tax=Burkholderia multivorans TaxID=87883 RepID=UPI0020134E03|nr:hypothetical protein [Burkholderia multivorans]MDN7944048.1 hypothetical protein [Burkholderia multivorans]
MDAPENERQQECSDDVRIKLDPEQASRVQKTLIQHVHEGPVHGRDVGETIDQVLGSAEAKIGGTIGMIVGGILGASDFF